MIHSKTVINRIGSGKIIINGKSHIIGNASMEIDGNGNPADVNEILYVNNIALAAYEEYVYTATDLQGTDIPDLKLVFDFGGAVAGSEIVISGITVQEHK